MTSPLPPFLSEAQFAAQFPRALTAAEQLVAANVLQVASNWIYNRLPNIAPDDPAAMTVVYEVTRDAILLGPYSRLSEFQNVTAHRTTAGKISASQIEEFITDRHARMLGISLKAMPVANFCPPQPQPGSWGAGSYEAVADYWEYM